MDDDEARPGAPGPCEEVSRKAAPIAAAAAASPLVQRVSSLDFR